MANKNSAELSRLLRAITVLESEIKSQPFLLPEVLGHLKETVSYLKARVTAIGIPIEEVQA